MFPFFINFRISQDVSATIFQHTGGAPFDLNDWNDGMSTVSPPELTFRYCSSVFVELWTPSPIRLAKPLMVMMMLRLVFISAATAFEFLISFWSDARLFVRNALLLRSIPFLRFCSGTWSTWYWLAQFLLHRQHKADPSSSTSSPRSCRSTRERKVDGKVILDRAHQGCHAYVDATGLTSGSNPGDCCPSRCRAAGKQES